MQKKSLKPWIILLILPWISLVVVALLQAVIRFVFTRATPEMVGTVVIPAHSVPRAIFSIISILLGMGSVLLILSTPAWIILLIKASDHNNKLEREQQAQVPPSGPVPPVA